MSTKKLQIIDYSVKQAENADTLDGKHAVEFAAASDVSDLQTKVGDMPVADQITSAVNSAGVLTIDITDAEAGTANLINADSLGGVAASGYVLDSELDTYKSAVDANYATKTDVSTNYLLKTETAADSNLLGGKAPIYYIQPRNLLDNSDFRNPVNQRGKTEYSNVSYTYAIDRWKTLDAGTVTVNDGYITTTNHLVQFMPKALNGVYTAAAKMLDGTILIASGSISGTGLIGDGETIQAGTESDTLSYFALRKTGSYVWAALYEGAYTADTLPPYVPKGYAAELAECQRYYLSVGGYWDIGFILTGTGYVGLNITTNIKMRAIPTPIVSGAQAYHPTYGWFDLTYGGIEWRAPGYRINFSWPDSIQASISDLLLINGVTGLSADL